MASKGAGALTGLRLLTKSDILAAPDLASEEVEVPEWGGTVKVRALDVNSRQAFWEYSSVAVRDDGGKIKFETKPFAAYDAALATLSIVGEDGEPMFTLAELEQLGSKNPEVITRIAEVARRLSKMGTAAAEEAEADLGPTNGASPSD